MATHCWKILSKRGLVSFFAALHPALLSTVQPLFLETYTLSLTCLVSYRTGDEEDDDVGDSELGEEDGGEDDDDFGEEGGEDGGEDGQSELGEEDGEEGESDLGDDAASESGDASVDGGTKRQRR